MATSRLCSIPKCGKPSRRKGWCSAHHKRWWRHGDPLASGAPTQCSGKKCSLENCDRPVSARGLCQIHYVSQLRHPKKGTSLKPRLVEPALARLYAALENQTDDCMIWTGSKLSYGYGCVQINNRRVTVHRIACELANGPANGRWALHKCDVPSCFNPRHLYWGTHADNMRDMHERGRGRYGKKLAQRSSGLLFSPPLNDFANQHNHEATEHFHDERVGDRAENGIRASLEHPQAPEQDEE